MYKFYCNDPLIENTTVILDAQESKHAIAVLRLKAEQTILLLNGNGTRALAHITVANKNACEIHINQIEHSERKGVFTLLISPPKSTDRWEYIVEKAQELNVSAIQPVITFHSERKKINTEKAKNIARAALKQCGAFYECEIKESISLKQAIADYQPGYFGYCQLMNSADNTTEAVDNVLIGPEGDFSEQEVQQLLSNNWKTMRLAENILRSETAAVTAIIKHNRLL